MRHQLINAVFCVFFAVWLVSYIYTYPLSNFLWTCNIAMLITATGIVSRHRALCASVALCLVAIPDLLWTLDVLVRFVSGRHLIGGTEYIFNSEIFWLVRFVSFEHVFLTPFLVYLLLRAGYDRRAIWGVVFLVPGVYYLSYFLSDPTLHTNWVWGLFAKPQIFLWPPLYPALAASIFIAAFAAPIHLAAQRWLERSGSNDRASNSGDSR